MSHNTAAGPERKWNSFILLGIGLFAFCLMLNNQTVTAQTQTGFEPRAELKASFLLSADLLKSDLYTVDEAVINDGLINHIPCTRILASSGSIRLWRCGSSFMKSGP